MYCWVLPLDRNASDHLKCLLESSRILRLKQKNYVHWNGKEGLSLWSLELYSPGFDFYGWQLVNLGVALSKLIWPLCSVQFSCSVVSNSLRPRGLQQARPPCPSPTPEGYSNSCPLRRWCHPTISSSVVPFSSCPQSSGSFPVSQLFTSGSQSIRVSDSVSVLAVNIQS